MEIKTLDLSNAINLKFVILNNVVIDNLILPAQINSLEAKESIIKNIQLNKINKIQLKNTVLNNRLLEAKVVYSYNSTFNEDKLLNNELICSDKNNLVISPNKINNEEIKITEPILIKEFLSPLFNKKNAIWIPERYAFDQKPLSAEFLLKETLHKKLLAVCKKEYHKDIELLSYYITHEISFFNKLKTLDCNYVSYKFIEPNNGVRNDIAINADFAQYLVNEKAYEQFILFESLRVVNPLGFNIEQFTHLLNVEPHDYIKKLIKEIEKDPYYLMNDDYSLVLNLKNKENIEKTYYKIHSLFISSQPSLDQEKIFGTRLFKEYWKSSTNNITNKKFDFELQTTEKKIKNLLNGNVLENIEQLSKILIKFEEEDYLLSSENKRAILFNMFDNCSIEDKLSDNVVDEINNVITEFKLNYILDRTTLINSFMSYTELQYNKKLYINTTTIKKN